MKAPILTVAPTVEPVDLAYFRTHARLGSGLDAEVEADAQAKLTSATRMIEQECGRLRLITSTWEYRLPAFPDGPIILPLPQVQSVTSIIYADSAGAPHTVSSSVYQLIGKYDTAVPTQVTASACVLPKYGQVWPTDSLETGEPIVITFVAGFVDANAVPEDLKAAIVLQAAHLWRNREAVTVGNTAVVSQPLARAVADLIGPYKGPLAYTF